MCYTKVMGQVDIYTTLLNLLSLESYRWSGIGQSILDSGKPGVAISPQKGIRGDALSLSRNEQLRIKQSLEVSDWILQFDKLKNLR